MSVDVVVVVVFQSVFQTVSIESDHQVASESDADDGSAEDETRLQTGSSLSAHPPPLRPDECILRCE